MRTQLSKSLILFVVLVLCAPAQGDVSVVVANPSFEQPGTGTINTVWDSIPAWDSYPGGNGLYKGYNPTDGLWTCYVQGNANTVFQPTGHTIQSGVTYRLIVDAKAQTGSGVQITIYCWKGPSWESKTLITSSDLSVSSSMAEKEISFDSTAHAGQRLIIGFECTGSSSSQKIAVDNVRVTYSSVGPDTEPPSPDPPTWTFMPSADNENTISMIATVATDPSGVEYYFMETSANPGASGWQDSRGYTDTGLDARTQYCYEVQARDKSVNQNATGWSTNECATTQSGGIGITIPITNPSFESGTTGWSGATTGSYEYYAAPDGTDYATRSASDGYTTQLTGHMIAAGETYTLTFWARTIHSDSYVAALQTSNPDTTGDSNTASAEARFYYGSNTITSVAQVVNPPVIQGAPQTFTNDDGGNVLVDQGYRMAFAENIFYQLESSDPIFDPWNIQFDGDYDHAMAMGVTKTAAGQKYLYSHVGGELDKYIKLTRFTGTPPDYDWGPLLDVLYHEGDENPATMDAHGFYDNAAGRLWLTWGGGAGWVSELDPNDGLLIGHPASPEFDTHPAGAHTQVANWSGDEWTPDGGWVEGASIFKHPTNGYWYFHTSYGGLAVDYTIRGGRGTSPNGPFYDKEGIGLMAWDSSEAEYGNSFLLGDDADQVLPGHPHIWEESGTYYLGYDYRLEKGSGIAEWDILGIRQLYFVNNWPTIWTPITVTFNADDYPAAIGQELGISFGNTGAGSNAAFDHISLTYIPNPIDVFNEFITNWLLLACGNCNGADLTGDGKVDLEDFVIYYLEHWLE